MTDDLTSDQKPDLTARSDDLSSVVTELTSLFRQRQPSIYGGWMHPIMAFAFYSQNGVVKNIGGRIATAMSKSDWSYAQADVSDFNWGPTQSRLETLRLRSKMRQVVLWWFIFGGGAIEWITDERGGAKRSDPLDPRMVRRVKRMNTWSAYDLEPEPGHSYASTPTFRVRGNYETQTTIHRSRLAIVVGNDVPPGLGRYASRGFINSITGWPPSPLEGMYRSHTDWRNAENDESAILHSSSIIHIALEGYRKARNGISEDEQNSVTAMLQDIVDNLSEDAVLFTDAKDTVEAITRNMAGITDVISSKRLTFLADTGQSEGMVMGTSAGNLGDKSGPRRDFNTHMDGLRIDVLTPVIEATTDHVLTSLKYQAGLPPEPEVLEIPTEYVTRWGPIDEQSGEEAALQRKDESIARKNDEGLVPDSERIKDPALQVNYSGLSAYLAEQEEIQTVAKEAEADLPQAPTGDLEAAAVIAKRLGVSQTTVHQLRRNGTIQGTLVGSRWKFHWPSVWAAIEGTNEVEEAQAEVAAESDRSDSSLGLSEHDHFGDCYGASVAMREIFAVCELVAPHTIPVLITGETGTGKELIARGMHLGSPTRGVFMPVNCGAFESVRDVAKVLGPLLMREGTVFLDEVGELPMAAQAAVLRLLAGDANARVVAATHRDLTDETAFRLDLLTRLRGVEVEVPPLRDREDDVLELARRFVVASAKDAGVEVPMPMFTADAIASLRVYRWPGNVRELSNVIRLAAIFSRLRRSITADDMQIGAAR